MANSRSTIEWMPLILGGVCSAFGAFTLISGHNSVSTSGSLILCGLLLLAVFTHRRIREHSSPPTGSAEPEKMTAEDLSSMTPPAWDAIPPTVGMAAQPDAYFHNRRDSR